MYPTHSDPYQHIATKNLNNNSGTASGHKFGFGLGLGLGVGQQRGAVVLRLDTHDSAECDVIMEASSTRVDRFSRKKFITRGM